MSKSVVNAVKLDIVGLCPCLAIDLPPHCHPGSWNLFGHFRVGDPLDDAARLHETVEELGIAASRIPQAFIETKRLGLRGKPSQVDQSIIGRGPFENLAVLARLAAIGLPLCRLLMCADTYHRPCQRLRPEGLSSSPHGTQPARTDLLIIVDERDPIGALATCYVKRAVPCKRYSRFRLYAQRWTRPYCLRTALDVTKNPMSETRNIQLAIC